MNEVLTFILFSLGITLVFILSLVFSYGVTRFIMMFNANLSYTWQAIIIVLNILLFTYFFMEIINPDIPSIDLKQQQQSMLQ